MRWRRPPRKLRTGDSGASIGRRLRGPAIRRLLAVAWSLCASCASNFCGLLRTRYQEGSVPPRFSEEVLGDIDHVVDGPLLQVGRGRVVRPVDQQGLADHVLTRRESPVAAVE